MDIFFTHVNFPHNLHLRLRPYASSKQGHACLPPPARSHVLTARITLASSSNIVTRSASFSGPKRCKFDSARVGLYGGWRSTVQPNLVITSWVCSLCVRHRRHFHWLLQRRYLSDDRVLTHTCELNISVVTCKFTHWYLYSGMRKIWDITLLATLVQYNVWQRIQM